MLQVCITCLQEITDLNFISLGDATSLTGSLKVRDVLSICVPELTLDLLAEPIMCATCMTSLHVAYDFRCKCLATEHRIRSYIDSLTQVVPTQVASQECATNMALYTAVETNPSVAKVKVENPEWYQGHQLEVWIKHEPQSSDDENLNKEEQVLNSTTAVNNQQESASANYIYSQVINACGDAGNNKIIRLEQDTDSGWSSSNADSDMNSSGDSIEGQQLRKALEAPRKMFVCDICKESFDRCSLLQLHRKIHEDKPFKCSLCSYSATLRLNLIRHMREHVQTKPQTYNLCECLEHPVVDETS